MPVAACGAVSGLDVGGYTAELVLFEIVALQEPPVELEAGEI